MYIYFYFTYPLNVFAYPRGYPYPRLNTTALEAPDIVRSNVMFLSHRVGLIIQHPGWVVVTSYVQHPELRSRSGDRISWLRLFVVFLGFGRSMLKTYIKMGHGRFLYACFFPKSLFIVILPVHAVKYTKIQTSLVVYDLKLQRLVYAVLKGFWRKQSWHDLGATPAVAWVTEETHENISQDMRGPEIRTEHHPNLSVGRYRYSSPLCLSIS
jgi:hypothetical protein